MVLQASKQLKKIKKGLRCKSIDFLKESGILDSIELANEEKGSDVWDVAVSASNISQYV